MLFEGSDGTAPSIICCRYSSLLNSWAGIKLDTSSTNCWNNVFEIQKYRRNWLSVSQSRNFDQLFLMRERRCNEWRALMWLRFIWGMRRNDTTESSNDDQYRSLMIDIPTPLFNKCCWCSILMDAILCLEARCAKKEIGVDYSGSEMRFWHKRGCGQNTIWWRNMGSRSNTNLNRSNFPPYLGDGQKNGGIYGEVNISWDYEPKNELVLNLNLYCTSLKSFMTVRFFFLRLAIMVCRFVLALYGIFC